jgi:type VI secretion system protein ImpK
MTPAHEMQAAAPTARPDTLALLFQGVFTAIVRIQSGRQALGDVEVFRRRMRSALQEAERDAVAARYSTEALSHGQFAAVAFLDEAILSSKDPAREEWRKKTLSAELHGEANAGEVFFDRLQALMRKEDSTQVADVLEVYLLCLLLGFEGKMTGSFRGEALNLGERMRRRIESIRGLDYRVAPPLELRNAAPRIALASVLLLFLLYYLHLGWRVGQLQALAGLGGA